MQTRLWAGIPIGLMLIACKCNLGFDPIRDSLLECENVMSLLVAAECGNFMAL